MMLELGHAPAHHLLRHKLLAALDQASPYEVSGAVWAIPVLPTVAINGQGIDEVVDAIELHRQHLRDSGELALRDRARLIDALENTLQNELMRQVIARLPHDFLAEIVAGLDDRSLTPQAATKKILEVVGLGNIM